MSRADVVKLFKSKLNELERYAIAYETWKIESLSQREQAERKKIVKQSRKDIIKYRQMAIQYQLGKGKLNAQQMDAAIDILNRQIDNFKRLGIELEEKA